MSSINRENFILRFLEIFPINGIVYNGNIGENIHSILDFQKMFPINGVPINGTQLYHVIRGGVPVNGRVCLMEFLSSKVTLWLIPEIFWSSRIMMIETYFYICLCQNITTKFLGKFFTRPILVKRQWFKLNCFTGLFVESHGIIQESPLRFINKRIIL